MPTSYPRPAREIAATITAAVDAARAQDRPRFDEAVQGLAALDQPQVSVMLASIVGLLLEQSNPDGLCGDDVRIAFERCRSGARRWLPDVDDDALLTVIGGALGMSDPDHQPAGLSPADLATHAALFIADLLTAIRGDLSDYLHAAIGEIVREETMELP